MAKLTTRYDKELKEKVFVLRGEEGYARTTDCILDEILHDPTETGIDPDTGRRIDWNNTIGFMRLEFRLDVLRDIGASYVVLYDGDERIGEPIPIDTNTHTIEFKYTPSEDTRLKLAYGVEHNLWAKYMGNKHCLKSESKKYNFNEPIPSHFESSLSFSSLGMVSPSTPTTISVTLNANHGVSGQTIYLYDGNTLLGSAITSSEGVATFEEVSFSTIGKHTLNAKYNGSEQLYSCNASYDISVGYILTITDYPSYLINSNVGSVTVSAVDYIDRPVSGKTIYIANDVSDEPLSDGVTTNSDGVAVINNVSIDSYPYYSKCDDGSHTYKSESVTTHIYNSVGITVSANPTLISNGFSTTVTGQVNQNVTQVSDGVPIDSPVTLNVKAYDYDYNIILTDTITTNATGGFTYNYNGSSSGNSILRFEVPDYVYTTVGVEDVIQYWKIGGTSFNRGYNIGGASLNELTQYYQLKPNTSYSKCTLAIDSYEDYAGDWILSFIVKESNGIYKLGVTSNGAILEVNNPQLSKGSEVMFYLKDKTLGVFINGVEVKNTSVFAKRTNAVYLNLTCSSSTGFMGFDELKYIKDRIEEI